jgi:hypothetical protein
MMKKALLVLALMAVPMVAPSFVTAPAHAATVRSDLGDLSDFETIATDTLALVSKGDLAAAKKRIGDFEAAWDSAQPRLYQRNKKEWGVIDDAADAAIAALRAKKASKAQAEATLAALLATLKDPASR